MQTNVNAYTMGFTDTLAEYAMFVRALRLSVSTRVFGELKLNDWK